MYINFLSVKTFLQKNTNNFHRYFSRKSYVIETHSFLLFRGCAPAYTSFKRAMLLCV